MRTKSRADLQIFQPGACISFLLYVIFGAVAIFFSLKNNKGRMFPHFGGDTIQAHSNPVPRPTRLGENICLR
jgi:hypothetical protein